MTYTKGPWEIVPTVCSTRKNLFGLAKYREYYIGTITSGSRKDMNIFRSNAAIISASPEMYALLEELVKKGRCQDPDTAKEVLKQVRRTAKRLLQKISAQTDKE